MASLAAILIILLLLIGLLMSPKLSNINPIGFGVLLGTAYFIFIPLCFLLVNKSLLIGTFPQLGRLDLKNLNHSLWLLFGYVVGLMSVFILIGKVYKKKSIHISNFIYIKRKQFAIYKLAILLYFLVSLIILFSSGILSGGHWYHTRGAFLSESGEWAVIALYMIWGLRLIIVSYTFELLEIQVIKIPIALLMTMVICGYELMFVGNRIVVLMFGIAGFVFVARRYGRFVLFSILLLILPIALSLALYQNVRHLLFVADFSETFFSLFSMTKTAIIGGQLSDAFLTIFEYADFAILMNLFSDVGETVPPLGGYTLLKIITWFIPRSFWSTKPDSITVLIGDLYLPGSGVSLVGLLFGEIHFNFGAIGVLIFPIILFMILYLLNYNSKFIKFKYYWGLLAGFLLIRSPISDLIVISIVSIILYKGLDFLYLNFKSNSSYHPRILKKEIKP